MRIIIQPHRIQLSREVRDRMERRLLFALNRFSQVIITVRVRLTDINDPKGGPDKHCLVVAKLRNGGELVIQGKAENSSTAMYHCADRLSRAVERRLKQRLKDPIRQIRRIRSYQRSARLESEELAHEQMVFEGKQLRHEVSAAKAGGNEDSDPGKQAST